MNIATAILFYSFVASTAILVFYYLFFFLRLKKKSPVGQTNNSGGISVIISSKNDSDNLEKNLPFILEQNYDNFEVIVVNDGADEQTDQVLFELKQNHPNLHVTHITDSQKTYSGKKLPLTLGIKKAANTQLILTDADCCPKSKNWLRSISDHFNKDIVIGYSPYTKEKGLLNMLIRYDATQIGQQYLSFAMAGFPYMGVGRNLGYNKDFFFKVGGFRNQYHIPAGDDDLFVNKFITKNNFSVVTIEDSFMYSEPSKNWRMWWKQKRRHLSTANNYKLETKMLLGFYHLSQITFYLSLILLLVNRIALPIVLGIYFGKTIIQLLISSSGFKKLKGSDLLALSPIYEPLLLLMSILVTFSLRFSNKIKWR
jgi:cellulose synthase/poly-beta-1,6-N-acetylglucosamine synthase-like glycosyltransferase